MGLPEHKACKNCIHHAIRCSIGSYPHPKEKEHARKMNAHEFVQDADQCTRAAKFLEELESISSSIRTYP